MGKFKFNRRLSYAILLLFVIGSFQNCGAPKKDSLAQASDSGGGNAGVVPIAPNQLVSVVKSAQQIDLTWQDNSNNESGFRIERGSTVSGPFSGGVITFALVYTSGADATSYQDTGLLANTKYTYRISAKNAAGISALSATTESTTPPAPSAPPTAPSLLAAAPQAATIVNLSWSDNSNNESYFKIERALGGGAFVLIGTTSADERTYQDINLNPATIYNYRVLATNSVGNSVFSNTGTATTPAAGNTNSFAYLFANIISPNCVACHGPALAAAGISYANYNLVNSGRAGMMSAINGNRMPPGAPLSATQKAQLTTWVNAGAQNN